MITPAEIDIAKRTLANVDLAASAADRTGCPWWLLCAVLEKETRGRNIYGHDRGGALSDPNGRNIEVTETNWRTFRDLVLVKGKTSNGVGPMQLTYRGFFTAMEKRGLKPWLPADNLLYGAELVAGYWKNSKGTVDQRVKQVGRLYNGASAYGDRLVPIAKAWRTRLAAAAGVPPVVPPVVPPTGDVGVWVVDPGQVQSVLIGRKGDQTGQALSPGTTIADGTRFVLNSRGFYALERASGWSYERSWLIQLSAGPVPLPIGRRPFPIIPDYDQEERILFRGGLVCRCVAISLPWVEYRMLEAKIIRFNIDAYQWSYRTDVKKSAASHAEGKMIDTAQYTDAALKIYRESGWEMQRREPPLFDWHSHGGPHGCEHGSTEGPGNAASQGRAWNKGRDGLAQNGPITGPGPIGTDTPRWDTALAAYLKSIGAPPLANV